MIDNNFIFKPIVIFSKQTNCPSFFYYFKIHHTRKKYGKNIVCRGETCRLCKLKIPSNNIFLIPVFYIKKDRYINVKVLWENEEIARKIFDIIVENLSKFNNNKLLRDEVYFIKNFTPVKINPLDYIVGEKTIEIVNKYQNNFYENYISKFITEEKVDYDNFLKMIKNDTNR